MRAHFKFTADTPALIRFEALSYFICIVVWLHRKDLPL